MKTNWSTFNYIYAAVEPTFFSAIDKDYKKRADGLDHRFIERHVKETMTNFDVISNY